MGTWGPAILSNDLAQDLKYHWEEMLIDGQTAQSATEKLIHDAKSDGTLDDQEDCFDFWLSLSLIQWKWGRLQPIVKQKALHLVLNNAFEEIEVNRKWSAADYKKRIQHISRLVETLQNDQPKPRRIKKRYKSNSIFVTGDIFSFSLENGFFIIFKVIDIKKTMYGTSPLVVIFNYYKKEKPSIQDLSKLEIIEFKDFLNRKFTNIDISSIDKKSIEPLDKIEILEKSVKVNIEPHMPCNVATWDKINEYVRHWINIDS